MVCSIHACTIEILYVNYLMKYKLACCAILEELQFNMHGYAVAYSYLLCTLASIIIVTFTVYTKLFKHCEMT